jgi:hypothetical protein
LLKPATDKSVPKKDDALRRRIRQGRRMFQIPENTDYYSEESYKAAEKKFIKLCVLEGRCWN